MFNSMLIICKSLSVKHAWKIMIYIIFIKIKHVNFYIVLFRLLWIQLFILSNVCHVCINNCLNICEIKCLINLFACDIHYNSFYVSVKMWKSQLYENTLIIFSFLKRSLVLLRLSKYIKYILTCFLLNIIECKRLLFIIVLL